MLAALNHQNIAVIYGLERSNENAAGLYHARDEKLNGDVAIKVPSAGFSQDTERLRRFEQEAPAAGSLDHPNILAVYVFCRIRSLYVVSALCE